MPLRAWEHDPRVVKPIHVESENPYLLAAMVMVIHTTSGHGRTNRVAIYVDPAIGVVPLADRKELRLRCLAEACGTIPSEAAYEIPIELVPAVTVAFHSQHEGHPLQITWDHELIHPVKG